MKKIALTALLLVVVFFSVTVASAAVLQTTGTSEYKGAHLPKWSGTYTLADHENTTSDADFRNTLTDMGGSYYYMNLWMETAGLGINLSSPKLYATYGNGEETFRYNSGKTGPAGTVIKLNLCLLESVSVRVEVSGKYNYK